ncbi:phage terminase small subunit P27 family [Selenomonas sp. AB3002]|uniref:phage terminase small subunit P27 family n=1 Tax=Selenomonas sp. AB3002 TaxID=1392502 RepID=UPI000496240A
MVGNNGGRPRKVVSLSTRKTSKKEKLERAAQESKLKGDRDQLTAEAPAWLTEAGKKEYMRVVTEAGKIPFLDNLDLHYIAMYADAVDKYIKAANQLHKYGDVIKTENGLTVSPFLAVQKKAEDTIMKCSSKLGLAITDRLRLIVPKQPEEKAENKYLKYLNKA